MMIATKSITASSEVEKREIRFSLLKVWFCPPVNDENTHSHLAEAYPAVTETW